MLDERAGGCRYSVAKLGASAAGGVRMQLVRGASAHLAFPAWAHRSVCRIGQQLESAMGQMASSGMGRWRDTTEGRDEGSGPVSWLVRVCGG